MYLQHTTLHLQQLLNWLFLITTCTCSTQHFIFSNFLTDCSLLQHVPAAHHTSSSATSELLWQYRIAEVPKLTCQVHINHLLHAGFLCRNSIPPTTTKKNLETKIMAAKGKTHVDVAFWGGVIPGNQVRWVLDIQAPSHSREKHLLPSSCPSLRPSVRMY